MNADEDIRSRLEPTPPDVPMLEPRFDDVLSRARSHRGRRRFGATVVGIIALLGVALPLASLTGLRHPVRSPEAALSVPPTLSATVAARVDVGAMAGSVAAADGSVWVTIHDENRGTDAVVRIDATTNQIVATISIDGFAYSIAVGDGAVWVPAGQPKGGATLLRIDEASNTITGRLPDVTDVIAVDSAGVWAVQGQEVVRVDPQTMAVDASIPVNGSPVTMVTGGDSVWLLVHADTGGPSLLQIDATTATLVRNIDLSAGGLWMAADGTGVWISATRPDGNTGDLFVPASGGPPEAAGSVYNFRPFAVADGRVWFISGPNDPDLPKGGICGLNIATHVVDVCAQLSSVVDLEGAHTTAAYESVTNSVWVGEYESSFVTRVDVREASPRQAIIRNSHRQVPLSVSADCPVIGGNAVASVTTGTPGTAVTVSGSIYYLDQSDQLVVNPTEDFQAWWGLNPDDYPSVSLQASAIAAGTASTPAPTASGPTMIGDYRPNGACAFLLSFSVPSVSPGTYPVSVITATAGETTVYGSFEFTVV